MRIPVLRLLQKASLLWAIACSCAHAGDLRILTTEVPPMAFTKDGVATGFCVEVVKEIQRRLSNRTAIEVLPWARAYQIGLTQPNVILICPKRTPERESIFEWVGPLLLSETNFYAKRGAGIRINSLEDAKKMSGILVPLGSYSYQYLLSQGFTNLEPVNTTLAMMRMLMIGRRPLMVMDRQQMRELLQEAHDNAADVEVAYAILPTVSSLAVSKGTSGELVRNWQTTLDKMKRDGSFSRLYKQWFPEEFDGKK